MHKGATEELFFAAFADTLPGTDSGTQQKPPLVISGEHLLKLLQGTCT
ncbi:hypothetical protein ASZ90_017159 [hydrocarbon metagenome]|uniref:Uncharacterized protein n=1 Tax=hydrocarbon metagenome TaxID=938273 RepID=A0A0W8EAC1_9ZZZZ